jgi:polyhydroxybutyrate depolymerase
MQKTILFFLLLTAFSCGKDKTVTPEADKASELITINLTVDNLQRSFLLYKPKGYNNAGKMPLVMVNHGGQGTSQGMLSLTDFRSLADDEKFLLIYPQAYQNSWNDGRPTTSNQLGVDDVNFFRQICNYAVANLSADNAKIYVTGISNGGFMSSRLGCELSDRIAAIAVVAATTEQGVFNNCNPNRLMPTIIIQGTSDLLVPINGGMVVSNAGGVAVSHAQAILKWTTINNCNTTPITTNIPDSANDGTTITKRVFNNTGNTTEVASYVITNGGHTWPQGLQYLSIALIGKTSQNMNANNVIWSFFKRWKRN